MGKWGPGAQGSKKLVVGTECGNKNPENKNNIIYEKENILLAGLLFPCRRSYQRVLDSNYWGTRSKWSSSANTKYLSIFPFENISPTYFVCVTGAAYFRLSLSSRQAVAGTGYLCLNILTYSRVSGQRCGSPVCGLWLVHVSCTGFWLAVSDQLLTWGGGRARKMPRAAIFCPGLSCAGETGRAKNTWGNHSAWSDLIA